MIVVADTCAFLAAYDRNHKDAGAVQKVLTDASLVIVSPLVMNEIDYFARKYFKYDGSLRVMEEIHDHVARGRYRVPEVSAATLAGAGRLRRKYRDLELDMSDAVTMALAAQFNTNAILTVDFRDFRTVAPLSDHEYFRILPADA